MRRAQVLPETQLFYDGASAARFFHVSKARYAHVFETRLFTDFEAQAVYSHTGFETFVKEYSVKNRGRYHVSVDAGRQRFAHAYFAWMPLAWGKTEGMAPFDAIGFGDFKSREGENSRSDATLLELLPIFEDAFTKRFGQNHDEDCRNAAVGKPCVAHMIDGHMKARRACCFNKWARVIVREGIGTNVLNCSRTPRRGSRFCARCRDSCADAGFDSLIGIDSKGSLQKAAAEAEEAADERGAASQHEHESRERQQVVLEARLQRERDFLTARGWAVSEEEALDAAEESVWMVEEVLRCKAATLVGLETDQAGNRSLDASKHRACARKKGAKMYLVKWAGWDSKYNQWVCGCSVGKNAIADFEDRQSGLKREGTNHAGKLAAILRNTISGEYVTTEADEKAFKDIKNCKCLKEFQYCEKKKTTAGILALVSCCGLVLKVKEIFGSETLVQTHDFLYEVRAPKQGACIPMLCLHDARMCANRRTRRRTI